MAIPQLLLIGTAIQAVGQIQAGYAAKEQAKQEQELLNYNAKLKEREAKLQAERGRVAAEKFEKQGEQLMAAQNVAYAKGGVLASQGTPLDLLEYTKMELDADRRQILRDGYLAESFALSEAENLRYQGRAARARGRNAFTGSILTGIGTSLSGFGTAKYMENRMNSPLTLTG